MSTASRSLHNLGDTMVLYTNALSALEDGQPPMRTYLVVAVAIFFIGTTSVQTTQPVGSKRPNILLVLADDLGFGELGYYGNSFNETRIDAFTKKSLRFTSAYAMPVCSPTRASLRAGKYPVCTSIVTDLYRGFPVHCDPAREYALPKLMRDADRKLGNGIEPGPFWPPWP